jgi:putative acetyltransferase
MSQEIEIREALEIDAPILCAAEKAIVRTPGRLISHPDELDEAKFRAKIIDLQKAHNGRYVVAVQNNEVIGHAFLDPLPLKAVSHVCHLTIAVHEGHQGQGIGEKLLNHLINWARANTAVEKIELHVRDINQRAIRLYEKCDFKEEGRWKKRVKLGPDQYCDDVAMGLWVK